MRWSYKTVHYELKKEGLLGSTFLDESEVEISLNEYGKAGWELISMLETMDGLIAVFKQPLSLDSVPATYPFTEATTPVLKKQEFVEESAPGEGPVRNEGEGDDLEVILSAEPLSQPPEVDEVFLIEEEEPDREELYVEPKKTEKKKDIGSIRIE